MKLFENTALALYAKRLTALKGQENIIFKKALDNKLIKDLITDLNSKIQLGEQSVDSLGNKLFNQMTQSSVYSESDPQGRGGQPYQVKRTGEYWESFKALVGQGFIIINSDPFKEDDNLFEIYGTNLEGLTDESLQTLINVSEERFIRWYQRNVLPK